MKVHPAMIENKDRYEIHKRTLGFRKDLLTSCLGGRYMQIDGCQHQRRQVYQYTFIEHWRRSNLGTNSTHRKPMGLQNIEQPCYPLIAAHFHERYLQAVAKFASSAQPINLQVTMDPVPQKDLDKAPRGHCIIFRWVVVESIREQGSPLAR